MMAQRLQGYVLQTMYADYEVGRLLDTLDARGLLDSSIVIVMSDHGASTRPGSYNRISTKILETIFFRFRSSSKRRDRPQARSIRGLLSKSTTSDCPGFVRSRPIRFSVRWSLIDIGAGPISDAETHHVRRGSPVTDLPSAQESPTVEWVRRLLPNDSDAYVFGPHGALVGQAFSSLSVAVSTFGQSTLAMADLLASVDLRSGSLPANVFGGVEGFGSPVALAVAMNGVIAGVGVHVRTCGWRVVLHRAV